jgi:hypothetical protein
MNYNNILKNQTKIEQLTKTYIKKGMQNSWLKSRDRDKPIEKTWR